MEARDFLRATGNSRHTAKRVSGLRERLGRKLKLLLSCYEPLAVFRGGGGNGIAS